MPFRLNPNAKDLTSSLEEKIDHIATVKSATCEAGHCVGTHARQQGRECRRSLGRLYPVNKTPRCVPGYEAESEVRTKERNKYTEQKQTKEGEGVGLTSASEESSTQGLKETERGTCGGSDLQCAHPACKGEERV